jgi:hypothetical protein
MAANDICADIAALLTPIPERPDQDTARDGNVDDDAYDDMAQEAWRERESLAETLRLSWQEEDADPLLSTLADLRQQRLRLEADMRLLMAYGRCFTHPRPPIHLRSPHRLRRRRDHSSRRDPPSPAGPRRWPRPRDAMSTRGVRICRKR